MCAHFNRPFSYLYFSETYTLFYILFYYFLYKIGSKIGLYNVAKAKQYRAKMDPLAGVRGNRLCDIAAFRKLCKEGVIPTNTMNFQSGKVN